MMTKTSLSATTWASPKPQRVCSPPKRYFGRDSSLARDARRFQWHRHSCLCAVAKPTTQQIAEATLSLPSQILIANPRLTLRINDRKTSPLKISNRKFSTIFRPEFSLFSSFKPPASSLQNLIETPRLKITINPILSSFSNFLIETKCDVCILDALAGAAFSVIPSPKTRIQCGARENPR